MYQIYFIIINIIHRLLSGFLTTGHLPQVSPQSRLSTSAKSDNEMIPGTVHKSPGIYQMAEENHGKPQLGDRLMKAVRPIVSSNGVPYLQMRSVGSLSTSEKEKEGNKDSVGVGFIEYHT